MKYVLSYDIGTTGVKTCLFEIGTRISLLCGKSGGYPLYILPGGGAEQDPDSWWNAMAETTASVLSEAKIEASQIAGISFCSQAQGVVLVDKDGVAVRRAMSYMDQRAKAELKEGIAYGPQIAGANIFKLIPSLRITGVVTSSVKDPVWKYKWVQHNEPETFARVFKWFDVKDYLICRCTGEFSMTEDDAFATLIYDNRKGRKCFSSRMCRMFNLNESHLPRIIKSTDEAGKLTEKAASELGLFAGTPVFGGGIDSALIGIGAGCTKLGDTHIYSGTSGWVSTITDKQTVDVSAMIASSIGAQEGLYNYFAELETAGKCYDWAKENLVKDSLNILGAGDPSGLFSLMGDAVKDVPAGSNGVIFTPWLHGNRCPFEDPLSSSMFFGIKLNTTKADLVHAVQEGVFYHLRWMLECQKRKVRTSQVIRFVGGTALSDDYCQMLCDIIGRPVETVDSPQNVGALGAAVITAVGLGLIPSIEEAGSLIPATKHFTPDAQKHAVYDKYYAVFLKLWKTNRKLYKEAAV